MKASLMLALAAGATLAVAAPTDAAAQDRSIRERWEQAARRSERDDEREDTRARERERDQERLRERERERIRALEREREQVRARERQLERERERLRERERELERQRARRAEEVREQRRIEAEQRRREEERLRRGRDRDWDDDDDDDDRYRRSSSSNGPAYCRSGEGHPVYGRDWCRDRGYELGRARGWERGRWGDIVFRGSDRRRNERLSRARLESVLGRALVNRFESHGRSYGRGPMTGYWMPENGNVLQLSVGNIPIARLIDSNRDRRVDYLLLRR
jgi:hypothetical protein